MPSGRHEVGDIRFLNSICMGPNPRR